MLKQIKQEQSVIDNKIDIMDLKIKANRLKFQ